MFGPPGAGKGTQAQSLVQKYHYYQLSTGDLLRNEIQSKSDIGNQISEIIGRGEFVSDDIVDNLIQKIIINKKYMNKIIFDGYPRNIDQAKSLDKMLNANNLKIGAVIFLNVKRNDIIKRIEGRVICNKCFATFNKFANASEITNHLCGSGNVIKRSDDNAKTIIRRFDNYMDITKPVLEYYSSNPNFIEIDGSLKINEISSKINNILKV